MIENIINYEKNNQLSLKRDSIKIDFYSLGVENDYNDNAKMLYYLDLLKRQERIVDFDYDGLKYTIIKPNINKLQEYLNEFNSVSVNKDVTAGSVYDNGCLLIPGYEKIVFEGMRSDIVNFFYNSANRKNWNTYENIKGEIGDFDTMTIRKAIKKINERFAKYKRPNNWN